MHGAPLYIIAKPTEQCQIAYDTYRMVAIVHGVALHVMAKPTNHEVTKYRAGNIPQDVLHNPTVLVAALFLRLGMHEQLEKT